MGIQGLLPLLKSIMEPINIKELQGCSVAIDTYSWLHKAALSCSLQLCKGLPTTRHIDYCMHRVNLLRHHGVRPILVFDGGFLPMKTEQENKRAKARRENFARAVEHEANGNSKAAYECYQKAVDISPALASELIQENVCYVVAPYEADAQMTFLSVSKQVDAVITEDSDLIPFGCSRIIFKMDKFGQGVQFQYSMLQKNKDMDFTGFTKQMLLEMCILSGCDYLPSLPGMGLKRAHALIAKFKSYEKVVKHLRYSTISVPPLYEDSFKKTIWTFRYQRVYDPRIEHIVHLTDLSDDICGDLDFLGPLLPQEVAKGIAEGDLDPFTKMPFQGQEVGAGAERGEPYLLKNIKLDSERRKLDLPVQKNLLTNYFCFASLEAKRKFRAPRISEKQPNAGDVFCLSSDKHVRVDVSACEINSNTSPASLLDYSILDSDPHSEDCVEDAVDTEVPENLNPQCNGNDVTDLHNNTRILEHATLKQPSCTVENPSLILHKEHETRKASDGVEGNIRRQSRKAVVRSPYFQHTFVDENAETIREIPLVEGETTTDCCGKSSPENVFAKFCFEGKVMKRKAATLRGVQAEAEKTKFMRSDVSCPSKSNFIPKSDETSMETNAEKRRFGTNISHLDCYSDIAEKSMGRFVSVISSSRGSSSGSRASGLRAPLKDVKNTYDDRPTVELDFSKFVYVPSHKKTASASNRG